MKKILLMKNITLLLLLFTTLTFAQKSEETAIKATINNFFEGMKSSDSTKIYGAFTPSPILQSFGKKGEARTEDFKEFVGNIAKTEKGILDERITFSKILIDGDLASVWTPYEFYYNGRFSHCGVNSIQLIKYNKEWKIQYIIDTRRKENCIEN